MDEIHSAMRAFRNAAISHLHVGWFAVLGNGWRVRLPAPGSAADLLACTPISPLAEPQLSNSSALPKAAVYSITRAWPETLTSCAHACRMPQLWEQAVTPGTETRAVQAAPGPGRPVQVPWRSALGVHFRRACRRWRRLRSPSTRPFSLATCSSSSTAMTVSLTTAGRPTGGERQVGTAVPRQPGPRPVQRWQGRLLRFR